MFNVLKILCLILCYTPTLFAGFFPINFEKTTVSQLQVYYSKLSNDAIYLKNSTDKNFYLDKKLNIAISEKIFDFESVQNIFATDVQKYTVNEEAADFLSAKKKFYARQKYSKSKQRYERPYIYLSAWNSLNHPQIKKLDYPLEKYNSNLVDLDYGMIDSRFFDEELHQDIDKMTKTELSYGNQLEQLNNNQSYFAKLDLIHQSKKYFFGMVMVTYCDESSSAFVNALIEKAKSGVDVRMIIEGIWTGLAFKSCVDKMRAGGVKVILSNNFFHPSTLFTVMHNKVWIADGKRAIIGGQNVHEFENDSTGFNMHTRDKDILIKAGPVVTDMLGEYIKLWNHFREPQSVDSIKYYEDLWHVKIKREKELNIRGSKNYKMWLSNKDMRLNGLCRVVVQGEQTERELISNLYLKLINVAEDSIMFSTPNLDYQINGKDENLNSELIYKMLRKAKDDRIKIDVVSNGIDASGTETGFYLRKMAERYYGEGKINKVRALLRLQDKIAIGIAKKQRKVMYAMTKTLGVDAWTYSGHIHAKQIIFDRILISTGTFNFDQHSYKNHEATLLCLDKQLAKEAESGFTLDMINSVPVL